MSLWNDWVVCTVGMEVYNKMEISRLAGMYLARLVDIVYIPPVKHGGGSLDLKVWLSEQPYQSNLCFSGHDFKVCLGLTTKNAFLHPKRDPFMYIQYRPC